MRIYNSVDEAKLRLLGLATAWRQSALITEAQYREFESSSRTDLKRTTIMMRILMFIFTAILIVAIVAFVYWVFSLSQAGGAVWFAIAAICSYSVAEYLAGTSGLYCHGAEEAFAVGALALALLAVGIFLEHSASIVLLTVLVEAIAAVGFFALFVRFGHLYMALAGIIALSCIPFSFFSDVFAQRSVLSIVLLLCVFMIWRAEKGTMQVLRREENSLLFAALLIGLCLAVNLRLGNLGPGSVEGASIVDTASYFINVPSIHGRTGAVSKVVYWLSYVLTYLIPLAGFWIGIKARRRALIIASALGCILALCTNKDYLGYPHYAWDPAILGLLLIGISIVLERWLRNERNGYTAKELLSPPSHGLEAGALAAGVVGTSSSMPASNDNDISPGGGSSGGGGSSRSF